MKKLISILAVLGALLIAPVAAFADEGQVLSETEDEICIETTVYGGGVGVVCGIKTHEPVDTGVEDIIPVLAGGLLVSSFLFYQKAKKTSLIA